MKRLILISTLLLCLTFGLILALPYLDSIDLNSGWNGFGIFLNDTYYIPGDVNVSIVEGWNLLGYSSNVSIDVKDINFIVQNDTVYENSYDIGLVGWNSFSIKVNESDIDGDINVSLVNSTAGSWNFLGYSSDNEILLTDIQFYDSKNNKKDYNTAIADGWILAINGAQDGLSSLPSAGDGETIFYLKKGDAFWLNSIKAVNISYEDVGGTDFTSTFPWTSLRFYNGTDENSISDAGTEGWIFTGGNSVFNYREDGIWKTICGNIGCNKQTLSPWEGIYVYSNVVDLELLVGNTTIPKPYANTYDIDSNWNALSIQLNSSDITGDINWTLANSTSGTWNFLGYSSDTEILLNDIVFYDAQDNSKLYQDAIDSNWIEEVNGSEDGLSSLPNAGDGEDIFFLKKGDAFWLKSIYAVNISYPDVGGSNPYETYPWNDIRFYNGTFGLSIETAGEEGWVTTTLQYWGLDGFGDMGFLFIDATGSGGGKTTLSPWEGIYVYSNFNNIQMLIGNDRTDILPYWDAVESNQIETIQQTNSSGQITGGDLVQTLNPHDAFWIQANQDGKLNFPDVGGWNQSVTFDWEDLRVYNGSDELNIISAGTEGWLSSILKYFNTDNNDFALIDDSGNPGTKSTLNPWEGYLAFSNFDNIELLTSNDSQPLITIQCPSEKKILQLKSEYMSKCDNPEQDKSKWMSILCERLSRRIRYFEYKCELWESKHDI